MNMNQMTATHEDRFHWNVIGPLFLLGLTGLLMLGAVVVPALALG
jgi:hypothetical protein